jgi:2-polyprenyl-3-methyl-5-hydroxy-6-metoxy-1,4-benzoquinol methylase
MPRLIEAGLLSYWLTQKRVGAAAPYLQGRVLDYACGVGVLTAACQPEAYLGFDIDQRKIDIASEDRAPFQFRATPPEGELFDTVAALAFIEHVADPSKVLKELCGYLRPGGRIVLTTPHPNLEWAHTLGSKLHLFSSAAHDEHEDLLDKRRMLQLAAENGLDLIHYKRFLFGANQLFVLRPA